MRSRVGCLSRCATTRRTRDRASMYSHEVGEAPSSRRRVRHEKTAMRNAAPRKKKRRIGSNLRRRRACDRDDDDDGNDGARRCHPFARSLAPRLPARALARSLARAATSSLARAAPRGTRATPLSRALTRCREGDLDPALVPVVHRHDGRAGRRVDRAVLDVSESRGGGACSIANRPHIIHRAGSACFFGFMTAPDAGT